MEKSILSIYRDLQGLLQKIHASHAALQKIDATLIRVRNKHVNFKTFKKYIIISFRCSCVLTFIYSIVKDSSVDLKVNSKIVQIRPKISKS